jgi:hypothetical protein
MAVARFLPGWLARGSSASPRQEASIAFEVRALASAAMPGIGVLLYCAYMWRLTGDPLAWAAGHAAWGREYAGVGTLLSDQYANLSHLGLYEYAARLPYDVLNALAAAFVLIATLPVARRLGVAYAVFILINLLPPLAAGGLMSVGRFSSVLFPVFIWAATVIPDRHRPAWLAGFMALQALNAVLFYTWRPLI